MHYRHVTPSQQLFRIYCPFCGRVATRSEMKPTLCKKCKNEVIFYDLKNLPKENVIGAGKTIMGLILLFGSPAAFIIGVFLFARNLYLAESLYLLGVAGVVCISGVIIGLYFINKEMKRANLHFKKLVETFFPAETTKIPLIDGVRLFELGKVLSGLVISCPNCAFLVERNSKFCKECGQRLE